MFKSTIIALLAATASAMSPDASIAVDSAAGARIMASARRLDQNNDMSWMAGYSIKYLGCTSLIQVTEEAANAEEGESNLYTMNLVKFAMCPSSTSCKSCGKGHAQYVVNMNEFIEAYTESKMNAQEQACENIRENCDCENANDDDVCQNQCYTNAGMDDCIEYDGDEEFDAQEYLECQELEANNNNNNNNNNGNNANYQRYFIGPHCKNGYDINLATFTDSGCTTKTKSGVYSSLMYGVELPFESESMVASDCLSCEQVNDDGDDNNNNNNNGDVEISEICEQSYEEAAKCEKSLSNKYYQDDSGCDYINNILPKLSKGSAAVTGNKISGSMSSSGGHTTAVVFAVLFAITTAVMAAYAFFLYRKIHRAKVNLSSEGGEVA